MIMCFLGGTKGGVDLDVTLKGKGLYNLKD